MIECSICGKEITASQMDDRHWLHDEGCPNQFEMGEYACECADECHEECSPYMSQEYEDDLIERALELTMQKRGVSV